ncbi:MAG: hypothetical protein RL701_2986 [Pseudomonadota bacterium]|jgi:predicted TPR repeat methyltransferase
MFIDDNRDIDPSQPLSLDDALLLGTRLHRLNQFDEAHKLYNAVLQVVPEHADALQFLGILEHQLHNAEAGLGYMQRALAQTPDAPGLHQNLGNILLELNRFDEAANAYDHCARLGGKTAELLNNIGILRRHQGQFAAAEAAYREALAINPDFIDVYNGYGRLLARQNRHKEALLQYSEALARDPRNATARYRLGLALCVLGRFEDAAQVYRDWLAVEPDNASAQHYLAACSGEGVPARASDAYVATTFDEFAQSFDAKLEALHYRAPELVGAALRKLLGDAVPRFDILDAGCGTGLCRPLLRPYAQKLVGVDLSARMLEKAKLRGGYDELYKAELTLFIEAHPESFDLIVSADTLCYFGDLEAVSEGACRALRPGGQIIFTVEALALADAPAELDAAAVLVAPRDYQLHPFGRYSHARYYVSQVLARAGFEEITLEHAVLRTEAAEPVHGYVVTGQRPAE